MDKVLATTLFQLGCNEKHMRFYKAALEMGVASLVEIAKKARLQRSTAYLIASEMVDLGLVSENHKAYRKLYVAAEPDALLRKLEAKHRQIGRGTIALREALPELRAAHQTTATRPRVRTFEGKTGLVTILGDILSKQQEILLWTNQEAERQFFDERAHQQFITERIAKNIPLRALAVKNKKADALLASDDACLRQTRILPDSTTFTSETYIYGNKVAILDIGKDIFGIITENEQIAASQRAIFELTWARSLPYSKTLQK